MIRAPALILPVLLAAASAAAQTPHLGRLFTTPLERQRLDSLRAGGAAAAGGLTPAAGATPAPEVAGAVPPAPPPAPLVVNGIVRRSDGRDTVWINQQVQHGQPVGTAGARRQPAVTLTLPNGAAVQVQPGQQVDPATGMVRNADQP